MTESLSIDRAKAVQGSEMNRILRHRAENLARRVEDHEIADGIQVVVMRLGSESYGVEVAHLKEVRRVGRLTPVPNVPSLWSGLIALRGTLVPVLDLRRSLGLPPGPDATDPKVAVVSVAGLEAGLLVDDVTEVREVPTQDMDTVVASETRINSVRAITPDLLSIIDLESVLTDPRLEIPDRPSETGGDE